jgi:sterol desaturase/sphingolipid hydroxylase (fatty acid hydroxylase superfamily)
MIEQLNSLFSAVQGWLFQSVVLPLMYLSGLGAWTEDAFNGTEWFMIGVIELALLYLLLRPLEAWIPVQPQLAPGARRVDFLYTCIHRLGIFTLAVFFVLNPLADALAEQLRLHGISPFNLEQLWPGVTDMPLASFFVYLLVLDFFDYWYHRASHYFNWWWGLHSLHHSQRDLNLWSDNRNHLLDDFLRDAWMALVALAIGVEPGQYVLLVAASRMVQSLQHANVRLHFGALGERLLVSPRYHRQHHAISASQEANAAGGFHGQNFAVLLPLWDIVFGTAYFGKGFEATGVRDQLPPPQGSARDYGRGFWAQQWLGLKRMREFSRRNGSQ